MIDTDDTVFTARLHLEKGTMLSQEAVKAICEDYLRLVEGRRQMYTAIAALTARTTKQTTGYDANGSETP